MNTYNIILLSIIYIVGIAILEYLGVWMIKTTLKRYSKGYMYIGDGVRFYKDKSPIRFYIFVIMYLFVSVAVMFAGLMSILAIFNF